MKADIQSRIGAENYETMKLWCGVKLSPIQVSPVGTQCLKAQWWTKLLSLNLCYAELSYIILGFWLGLTYCTRTTVKYGWLSNDNWDPWFSTFQTLFWPSIVKNTKSQKHEWMNEWMNEAFMWHFHKYYCTPKALYNHVGVSPQALLQFVI